MVPGSTLMYGSNFIMVTRSPRSTSNRPSDAAAMPLPSEDTTPPVTKMYLVVCSAGELGISVSPRGGQPSAHWRAPDHLRCRFHPMARHQQAPRPCPVLPQGAATAR